MLISAKSRVFFGSERFSWGLLHYTSKLGTVTLLLLEVGTDVAAVQCRNY